jgi:CRISPR-associated protein Cmr5
MPTEICKSLDQRRAAHAFRTVNAVKAQSGSSIKEFKTQVKKMPARIMTSGLGPALAFLEAKKYAPELLAGLADWIQSFPIAGAKPGEKMHLLARIIDDSSDFLRFATAESLAYLQWVGRFADAVLPKVDDTQS